MDTQKCIVSEYPETIHVLLQKKIKFMFFVQSQVIERDENALANKHARSCC